MRRYTNAMSYYRKSSKSVFVSLVAATLLGLAATNANAQTPREIGRLMYGFDLIANYCPGHEAHPSLEAVSRRAVIANHKMYYEGYNDGAKIWDPRLKKLGEEKFCLRFLKEHGRHGTGYIIKKIR